MCTQVRSKFGAFGGENEITPKKVTMSVLFSRLQSVLGISFGPKFVLSKGSPVPFSGAQLILDARVKTLIRGQQLGIGIVLVVFTTLSHTQFFSFFSYLSNVA
jgi:hypothetical protein